MRFIRSFGLIGAGAFAAGIFYSKSGYDHEIGNWLVFAVSLAMAIGGLIDLVEWSARDETPASAPLWLKKSH